MMHLPLLPYAFFLAVPFLCVLPVFCAIACSRFSSSCAFINVGAFSHGLDRCMLSFRLDVVSLAVRACVRGIPYFARYDIPSNPCALRCLPESCLKLALHARHVTWCLVMLFRQLTRSGGVAGAT